MAISNKKALFKLLRDEKSPEHISVKSDSCTKSIPETADFSQIGNELFIWLKNKLLAAAIGERSKENISVK